LPANYADRGLDAKGRLPRNQYQAIFSSGNL